MFVRALAFAFVLAAAACGGDDDPMDPTPDASADPDTGGGGGTLGFMEECDTADDQCDTSQELFCRTYRQKGDFCTHACDMDLECEDPSPGCSANSGVCRAP